MKHKYILLKIVQTDVLSVLMYLIMVLEIKKLDIDKIFLSVLNIQDKIDDIASKICPCTESAMINYEDMSVVVNGIYIINMNDNH